MKPMIYLDHAATTGVRPEVLEEMLPYLQEEYGNPSSVYDLAGRSRKAVEEARQRIAGGIGAKPEEIYFTGGGSESDNWVLKGIASLHPHCHIITTRIEHHAVLHACEWLEQQGMRVTYLPVNEQGMVSAEQVRKAIRPDTVLISVMFANNEIGTIQPIREIGRIARRAHVLFHTDAVQAFGHVPIDVNEMNIDLMSASAHKLSGPKGVGMLYIKAGIELPPLIHGGGQERHMRAGTENVPGIAGFGKAAQLAFSTMRERSEKISGLRDYLIRQVLALVPYTRLNGSRGRRLPGNANFSFQFIEGESLLVLLDTRGICASAGSACSTGSPEPSHVLTAIGLPKELAHASVRLTIGEENTKEEIDYTIQQIMELVSRLREVSDEYDAFTRQQG